MADDHIAHPPQAESSMSELRAADFRVPTTAPEPPSIFLIGAQCTGKTTLLEALMKPESLLNTIYAKKPKIIHEVVREVMTGMEISTKDRDNSKWQTLQRQTLIRQNERELECGASWFISDRSGLDPLVYADEALSKELRTSQAWLSCRDRMRAGVVILCEAGNKAWLGSDEVRLSHSIEEWLIIDARFRIMLNAEGIKYFVLSNHVHDVDRRVQMVMAEHGEKSLPV